MTHLQYLCLFSFKSETELTDWWQVYRYLYYIHCDNVGNGFCCMYSRFKLCWWNIRHFCFEGRDSRFLQNVGNHQHDYTILQLL